jgi:Fe-S cluster biosynthesis and repair protein YggX
MSTNKQVYCKKYGCEKPALDEAPLMGPIGQLILENISAEAWQEWVEAQIKIINETRLDLSDEKSQSRLYEQMIEFLNLRT